MHRTNTRMSLLASPLAFPTLLIFFAIAEGLYGQGCGGYLLVPEVANNQVLRYDATTGAFVDVFVPRRSGGLNQPYSVIVGPHDGHVYVPTGHWEGPGQIKAVLRFDGVTGAFLDEFVQRGQMDQPHQATFGPDGNLYVPERVGGTTIPQGGRVLRFNGVTGAFIDVFVPLLSGGLWHPIGHVFGPSGRGRQLDLYVGDVTSNSILRYDGATGAFLGAFVASQSGGLQAPAGMSFGPDGNLYVASSRSVMRFQGAFGKFPGSPMPSAGNSGADFVSAGSGGLLGPLAAIFGPDGNGDGNQDLYVANWLSNAGDIKAREGNVKRFDGVTGAFIDTFVPTGSGGLKGPGLIAFTTTNPVTLRYVCQ